MPPSGLGTGADDDGNEGHIQTAASKICSQHFVATDTNLHTLTLLKAFFLSGRFKVMVVTPIASFSVRTVDMVGGCGHQLLLFVTPFLTFSFLLFRVCGVLKALLTRPVIVRPFTVHTLVSSGCVLLSQPCTWLRIGVPQPFGENGRAALCGREPAPCRGPWLCVRYPSSTECWGLTCTL